MQPPAVLTDNPLGVASVTLAITNFVDTGCKYLLTLSALVGTNC